MYVRSSLCLNMRSCFRGASPLDSNVRVKGEEVVNTPVWDTSVHKVSISCPLEVSSSIRLLQQNHLPSLLPFLLIVFPRLCTVTPLEPVVLSSAVDAASLLYFPTCCESVPKRQMKSDIFQFNFIMSKNYVKSSWDGNIPSYSSSFKFFDTAFEFWYIFSKDLHLYTF